MEIKTKRLKATVLKIILFFGLTANVFSQELLPFVENYNKSNYEGDNQIWNLSQGADKAMYFANHHYLLRYNGVNWEKYNLPNKTIIRSVLAVGDTIYSGSYKEFGYWLRKEGKMNYVSISNQAKVFGENENEEIWKIIKFKNQIYFQSFNTIFKYDGQKIKKTILPFLISYCFVVDNQLLIASVEKGIYRLTDAKLQKINGLGLLEKNVIHAIQKYQNKTYFFTKKKGVFVLDQGVLSPWKNPLNQILRSSIINAAQFLNTNKLVIGTAANGIYLLNLKEGTTININRSNVLMNNSVLSIGIDKEQNLWFGLDNGIAHVEVNSPIALFYDNSGVLGSVYSVAKTENGYLMASNHGVFEQQSNKFYMLPNSQGQAWNINKINNKFLIGHNEGTFTYDKGHFEKLNSINGGWTMSRSNFDNSYLQATYSGVQVYSDSTNLSKNFQIPGLLKPIKYVAQNRHNEIWAADNYKGLYRIILDNQNKTSRIENVSQLNKIANDFGVKIFEFRNEILFYINKSWYSFNSIANLLEKNKLFNANFPDISDIVRIDDSHFIIVREGLLYTIYADKNKFVWNLIQEKYYKGKIINDYLKIFKTKDTYLVNLDDGFLSLQIKNKKNKVSKLAIEAFVDDNLVANNAEIKFNSEIKINVISGKFGETKPNLFYKINNDTSFTAIQNGLIVLNNLNSGKQNLKIFANDGLNHLELANFKFVVLKPWYSSSWMLLLYLIVFSTITYLYYKWNKFRYIQKLSLQEEEMKHQKKILELQLKAENELNLQEYEKHILELELKTKSSQVAGKSLSIAKQTEMIDTIQLILETETDFNKLKSEIKKAIKINAVNKHEWETFETNLNLIHNEFSLELSKKFPKLTAKDIKLCIFLKMNLSSKEIAPMMNISFRGVELQRYRLRKKLGLNQEDNLNSFLLLL